MINVIEGGHLTNIRAYADNYNLIFEENRNLVHYLQNRMGYHIVIKSAAEFFENNEVNEREFGIILTNKGVAPMYFDCKLKAALLDDNNQVKQLMSLDEDPRKWYGNSNHSFRFRVSWVNESGRVAIGLFKDQTKEAPDVRFANSHTINNWVILD